MANGTTASRRGKSCNTYFETGPKYQEVRIEALLLRAESATAINQTKLANDDLYKVKVETRKLLDTYGSQPDHVVLRATAFSMYGRLALTERNIPEAIKNFEFAVQVYQSSMTHYSEYVPCQRGLEEAKKELQSAKK